MAATVRCGNRKPHGSHVWWTPEFEGERLSCPGREVPGECSCKPHPIFGHEDGCRYEGTGAAHNQQSTDAAILKSHYSERLVVAVEESGRRAAAGRLDVARVAAMDELCRIAACDGNDDTVTLEHMRAVLIAYKQFG